MAERWDGIHVVSKDDSALNNIETGVPCTIKYVVDEQGLDNAVGLELVIIKNQNDTESVYDVKPFEMKGHEGNNYTFECSFEPDVAGSFKVAVRMYPKNENLPHRQDFCYVKYLDL